MDPNKMTPEELAQDCGAYAVWCWGMLPPEAQNAHRVNNGLVVEALECLGYYDKTRWQGWHYKPAVLWEELGDVAFHLFAWHTGVVVVDLLQWSPTWEEWAAKDSDLAESLEALAATAAGVAFGGVDLWEAARDWVIACYAAKTTPEKVIACSVVKLRARYAANLGQFDPAISAARAGG